MHPSRSFSWDNHAEKLAYIQQVSFSTIFISGQEGMYALHVPVMAYAPNQIRFHIFRANRAVAGMEGARALLSCIGVDAYISPDWYGAPDKVPTWSYIAVEAEGSLRQLEEEELVALLDDLSAKHEAQLAPKKPWSRHKMTPGLFEKVIKAIVGYELVVEELRGTRKLEQHKNPAELAGAAAGLEATGRADMAALMRLSSVEEPNPK